MEKTLFSINVKGVHKKTYRERNSIKNYSPIGSITNAVLHYITTHLTHKEFKNTRYEF